MARFLLLHAFPLDGAMWREVSAALSGMGHEVLAPDLRGFGRGSHVASALSGVRPGIDVLVDDALGLLEGEPAIVAGCSLGGYVAQGIAVRRPDAVTALGLVDTKATADGEAARARREAVAAVAEAGGDWSAGMVEALLGATTRSRNPEIVQRVTSALAVAPRGTVAWMQRAMAIRPDSREALATLRVPVAVIVGAEDEVSPIAEQELILDAAPGARLTVVPGAGHLTPLESPAHVAAALATLVA